MGLKLQFEKGQTPLDEDDLGGLLIKSITTQGELNDLERLNIESAMSWTLGRKQPVTTILTELFVRELHKKMYGDVWRWAGTFRKTDTNIGVPWQQIAVSLKELMENTSYWFTHQTFSPDETAIRFKHRIVSIHCFPNGNGRHSRLIADIIINHVFKLPVFKWGAGNLTDAGNIRSKYLAALKEADKDNFKPLLAFARS